MLGGKTMWVVSTSALLLGVPFALALVEEQQVVEMEKEQRMREMGNEVSSFRAGTGKIEVEEKRGNELPACDFLRYWTLILYSLLLQARLAAGSNRGDRRFEVERSTSLEVFSCALFGDN